MDKNRGERIEKIQEEVEKLPEEIQRAIIGALKHWDMVELLCKESKMTDEEIEEMKITAREREDYLLLVFLYAAQAFNNDSEMLE